MHSFALWLCSQFGQQRTYDQLLRDKTQSSDHIREDIVFHTIWVFAHVQTNLVLFLLKIVAQVTLLKHGYRMAICDCGGPQNLHNKEMLFILSVSSRQVGEWTMHVYVSLETSSYSLYMPHWRNSPGTMGVTELVRGSNQSETSRYWRLHVFAWIQQSLTSRMWDLELYSNIFLHMWEYMTTKKQTD